VTKKEYWEELQKKVKVVEAFDEDSDAWFHFEYLYEEEAE